MGNSSSTVIVNQPPPPPPPTLTSITNVTNRVISRSMVSVESHCIAAAKNLLNIDIEQPPGCTATTGTVNVSFNVTQGAQSDANCNQKSNYEALLRGKVNADTQQIPPVPASRYSAIAHNAYGDTTAVTNLRNTISNVSDYSDLHVCRSHAQNVVNLHVNRCGGDINVDGTASQQALAKLERCVNGSTANAQLAGGLTQTAPIGKLPMGSLGNIMVTVAIVGTVVALLAFLYFMINPDLLKKSPPAAAPAATVPAQ